MDHEYAGTFRGLLNPYALLIGVTTLVLFMMHGASYVVLKTQGRLHDAARGWVQRAIIFFIICYALTTMATLLYMPHMGQPMAATPFLFVLPVITLLVIANVPREIYHERDLRAFCSSCVAVASLLALFGIGMYPYLVRSVPNPEHSLTISNTASSPKTLRIMLAIALMGLPLVLAYTVSIYWIFRGKVRIDRLSH